jgi:hypothetical protein
MQYFANNETGEETIGASTADAQLHNIFCTRSDYRHGGADVVSQSRAAPWKLTAQTRSPGPRRQRIFSA